MIGLAKAEAMMGLNACIINTIVKISTNGLINYIT